MTLERTIADLFSLNDEAWLRHANPWSVFTRFTAHPQAETLGGVQAAEV